MRCNVCGSDNAKVYQRITDGRETTLTVCPSCYRKLYPEEGSGDFFTSFMGRTKGSKACEGCGTTLEEFRHTGLLGCAYCYTAFREELLPTIRYVQGKLQHEGKVPSGTADENYDTVRELVEVQERLRAEVSAAEQAGDTEEVKRLRARLDAVNKRLYGGEGA